jgi:hypothetical protein
LQGIEGQVQAGADAYFRTSPRSRETHSARRRADSLMAHHQIDQARQSEFRVEAHTVILPRPARAEGSPERR